MSTPSLGRRWVIAEQDRAKTSELSQALGIPRISAHLLALRGITGVDEGRRFLNPSINELSDPFSLTDMQSAVDRIQLAHRRGERVRVFGDYDVDGIAGTAVLLNAMRRFGLEHCDYGLPSRVAEGYGLGPDHVEAAHAAGVSLIITVDNGINAREAAATAQRLGIDLIVTDHHQLEGALPQAVAIVDPKRESEDFPARDASGTVVAFKLAQALTGEIEDLDLVALGTVADIVPLRGENRVLVALGLDSLSRHPRVGLVALASAASVDIATVNAEKIAFQLAPRLNAAGRLGDGAAPLELLLTHSSAEAGQIAAALNRANDQRRTVEKAILEEAVTELDAFLEPEHRSIVLGNRGWHPGVIGIVAARLLNQYNRPVVLVAIDEDGIGRGSARSSVAFDMAGALAACSEHLMRFGGHAAAAGLALTEDRLGAFREAFECEARKRGGTCDDTSTLDVDALISLSEVDAQLVKTIEQLEPFGCMNPWPVFCTCGVTPVPQSLRELQGGHLRFSVKQGPRVFNAVGFRMAGNASIGTAGQPVDIAFTPRLNTWRGETSIQLVLKDVRPS